MTTLFSSPISHCFVFLILPRPETFQDECLHHREVYVRLPRRNKTDYINELLSSKIKNHSGMFLARMQSVCVCVWTGGCLCVFVWMCVCLYDEQSQICMDTVIGILSVSSCSLKRDDWERRLNRRSVHWTDLLFYYLNSFSLFYFLKYVCCLSVFT